MPRRELPHSPERAAPGALVFAIARFAQSDGDHDTAIPTLTLHRRSAPTVPLHCIYNLGLGVVAQGGKQVLIGSESIACGPAQSMLTTIDLPVVSHVTRASAREPFLGMMLTLDVRSVVQIASELDVARPRRDDAYRSISFEPLDRALLDALVRLVRLLDEPTLAPRLAPLIQQEVVIRLLTGPHGPQLLHLVTSGSPSQQIAKSVAWLKQNFVETLRIDDVARRAHMSPSTFRQHFRALTGVSPLQYQKQLRLQEARQLMLNENLDAGSAAGRVGYESPSQFSREYSRLFGAPPQRDVNRMRETTKSASRVQPKRDKGRFIASTAASNGALSRRSALRRSLA
jgi:AraC-like DNA-binding protein